MAWIWSALFAGLFQAWRTALQQRLRASLSVSGAGFVRYGFGIVFAVPMAWGWLYCHGERIDAISWRYLGLAAAAGLAQIFGTALLIQSFGHRGFVVGTAFSKTEALQAAAVAALFSGERLTSIAWTGIGAGLAGVLILALAGRGLALADLRAGLRQPAALCGLGAAGLFAITGLLVKAATSELAGLDPIGAALTTLVAVMGVQTLMHGLWIAVREPGTFTAMLRNRTASASVGFLSACGSACWFSGFALAPVALVRIVGQVEVIFTVIFAHRLLKERIHAHEVIALLLVALGVVLALVGGHV